jgi:hypothetical protein
LRGKKQRENPVAETAGCGLAALAGDARIGRYECGIERALGENRAEMVRQAECDEEGVGDRPGADDGRKHDVARKTGHARDQRVAANGENLADHSGRIVRESLSPRAHAEPRR